MRYWEQSHIPTIEATAFPLGTPPVDTRGNLQRTINPRGDMFWDVDESEHTAETYGVILSRFTRCGFPHTDKGENEGWY